MNENYNYYKNIYYLQEFEGSSFLNFLYSKNEVKDVLPEPDEPKITIFLKYSYDSIIFIIS